MRFRKSQLGPAVAAIAAVLVLAVTCSWAAAAPMRC